MKKLVDHGAELDIRNSVGQSLASLMSSDLLVELSSRQCVSFSCSDNEICINLNGEHVCECKTGFFRDQTLCVDIDECLVENCLENSICRNIPGSFSCLCLPGYEKTLDGSCENVNECLTSPCNDINSYCVDNRVVIQSIFLQILFQTTTFLPILFARLRNCVQTEGSYFCTCKQGLKGDGGFSSGCVDENECINHPCDENAVCENSFGSFKCTCLGGYTGDGFTCSDINECLNNPCVDPRTCSNFDGGFSCSCTDSIGTGIKETTFEQLTYLESPVNYDAVARENMPPQKYRIYPGCTGIWGDFASSGECSCETQTLIKTRNCTTETPCDESYCDVFEDGVCTHSGLKLRYPPTGKNLVFLILNQVSN